jgi:hypothetical protein
MKAELVIHTIKSIKNRAAKEQMYDLACNLRDVERELSCMYTFEDDIDSDELIILLQKCLYNTPEEQKQLLLPTIREFKLEKLL